MNKVLSIIPGICLNFIFLLTCYGQKPITKLSVEETVIFATVDRPGELYVVLKSGKIKRYDTQGQLQAEASFSSVGPTLFEPRDGARLFIFSRSKQQYAYLKPSLSLYEDWQSVDEAFVIQPFLISTAGDHHLLILDSADLSLKKLNTRTNILTFDVTIGDHISSLENLSVMREYQNFVFLLDQEKGIHIFNGIGTFLRTIPVKDLMYFNFLGEELYYPEKNELKFFNLFSAEQRQVPLQQPSDFTMLTDERKYIIKGNQIEIFTVKP